MEASIRDSEGLCPSVASGEEEASRAAVLRISASISADVQARRFRRANAKNCRPAILEAREHSERHEPSASRIDASTAAVRHRLLASEEWPHLPRWTQERQVHWRAIRWQSA